MFVGLSGGAVFWAATIAADQRTTRGVTTSPTAFEFFRSRIRVPIPRRFLMI